MCVIRCRKFLLTFYSHLKRMKNENEFFRSHNLLFVIHHVFECYCRDMNEIIKLMFKMTNKCHIKWKIEHYYMRVSRLA